MHRSLSNHRSQIPADRGSGWDHPHTLFPARQQANREPWTSHQAYRSMSCEYRARICPTLLIHPLRSRFTLNISWGFLPIVPSNTVGKCVDNGTHAPTLAARPTANMSHAPWLRGRLTTGKQYKDYTPKSQLENTANMKVDCNNVPN